MLLQDQDTARLSVVVDRVESGEVPGRSRGGAGGAPGGDGGTETEPRQDWLGPPGGNVPDSLQETAWLDAGRHPAAATGLHHVRTNFDLLEYNSEGPFIRYYISFRECKLWYLYVRKTHGWYQEQFITIKVTRKVLGIFILMVVLPLLKKFKISDINLLIAFNFLHGIGFFLGSLSMFTSGFLISGQQ